MGQTGLIVVSHGYFAKEALNSVEMIIGKQKNAEAISLMPGEALEELKGKIDDAIVKLGNCSSIFIMSDVWGGTPSNASMEFALTRNDVRVISGLNIPMLIEFFNFRNLPADRLIKRVIDAGRKSIVDTGNFLLDEDMGLIKKSISER